MNELPRIAARLFNAPLLITPNCAVLIASNLADRFGVEPIRSARPGGLSASIDDDDEEPYVVNNGIATISVRGELVNRGSWLSAQSGLTSYEALQSALRAAAADVSVRGILLDIDSPGGEAAGAMETADVVREVSKTKPVKAFVNSLAASAAYAIAAGASEIIVTPSATVGSIGVVWLHLDRSAAYSGRA